MGADGRIGAETRARLLALATVIATALAGCSSGDRGSTDTAVASRATEASTAGAASPDTQAAAARSFADTILAAVNATRATPRACGTVAQPAAGTLEWDPLAEQAALAHAQYLQQNNLFSHTGANGSGIGDRLSATGYVWTHAGENIAAGFDDVAAVMKAWIDSPGHCVNLMNPAFTELAVVRVPGTSANTYRSYWVMVLARPRG